MDASEVAQAVAAARSTASAAGLAADGEAVVLQDSNRLTLRLLPGDVLARVAPHAASQGARLELELAGQLVAAGAPVAAPHPAVERRVHPYGRFGVTLWTYYEPVTDRGLSPADYGQAMVRLHAGMAGLQLVTPHFLDRVHEAQQLLQSRSETPALPDDERELLGETLRQTQDRIGSRGRAEQLLHGEPHPGNVLSTEHGLLFTDLETCCRGPVEFDLAHAPEEVGGYYPGLDQEVLRDCRLLALAMIITWRWDRTDQLPDGRRLGTQWLGQLRAALTDP